MLCRYYAICRPLQARSFHTVRRTSCLVVVFWVVSLVMLLPQLLAQRLEQLLIIDVHPPLTFNSTPTAEIRFVDVCTEFFPEWRWNVAYTFLLYVAVCIFPVNYVETFSVFTSSRCRPISGER